LYVKKTENITGIKGVLTSVSEISYNIQRRYWRALWKRNWKKKKEEKQESL